jgi:cytochrome b
MIVALLLSLIGTCWSGLEVYGKQGHGPLALVEIRIISSATAKDGAREHRGERGTRRDKRGGEEFWGEIHEALANLTLLFVLLHVTAAVVTSVIHRENLIKAMITGYKTRRAP